MCLMMNMRISKDNAPNPKDEQSLITFSRRLRLALLLQNQSQRIRRCPHYPRLAAMIAGHRSLPLLSLSSPPPWPFSYRLAWLERRLSWLPFWVRPRRPWLELPPLRPHCLKSLSRSRFPQLRFVLFTQLVGEQLRRSFRRLLLLFMSELLELLLLLLHLVLQLLLA